MSLQIRRADTADAGWQALARERGSFYHEPAWSALLSREFGFRIEHLTAHDDDCLVGILPLARVRGFSKARLVSLPFSYAVGPVARDAGVTLALMEHAHALAKDEGRSIEIKSLAHEVPPAPGYSRREAYSTYVVDMSGGETAVYERLHAGSTRRSIKKALKSNLSVATETSAEAWLSFAKLQEGTSHGHGLPAPPRSFFVEGCRGLAEQGLASLRLARLDGTPVAGIVLWQGARQWIYAFGASRPDALELRPNHLLIWRAIQDAIVAGKGFDLGRASPQQPGLVEFKQRWGAQAVPLAYDYWPEPRGLNTLPRDRGALALFGRVWSHLPGPVARAGSVLYRYMA
jgi:CelD/BcsL family acetyltransferase involved in cellulose biosynthesis